MSTIGSYSDLPITGILLPVTLISREESGAVADDVRGKLQFPICLQGPVKLYLG